MPTSQSALLLARAACQRFTVSEPSTMVRRAFCIDLSSRARRQTLFMFPRNPALLRRFLAMASPSRSKSVAMNTVPAFLMRPVTVLNCAAVSFLTRYL